MGVSGAVSSPYHYITWLRERDREEGCVPLGIHTVHGTGKLFRDQVNSTGTRYRVQGSGVQFMDQANRSGAR